MTELSRKPADSRDSLLLSRKFCVAWTTLGLLSAVCAVNALLSLAKSKLVVSEGIGFGGISTMETLAVATPIVAFVQFLFLYLTHVHGRARKQAGLAAGFPPAFAMDWGTSLAVGLGRTLVYFGLVFPLLAACLLFYKTIQQPLHTTKAIVAQPFESVYRVGLFFDPAYWRGLMFLGTEKAGHISFFPVLLPAVYGGLILWTGVMAVRLMASHGGKIAPLKDYARDDA